MKKVNLVLSFLFAFYSFMYSQEIATASKVAEVTVYRNLAKETRSASFTIPAGNSDVVLSGVSTLMTDQSLQVAMKGNATLLSATVRMNYFTEKISPKDNRTERYQDSIMAIDIELSWIYEQQSVHQGELDLTNLMLQPVVSKEGYKPADVNALLDIYRTRITDLKRKKFDLSLRESSLNLRKEKFEGQLSELGEKRPDPVKEIVLSFSAEKEVTVQLRCMYLVSSAGWTPAYDIHVENTSGPVDLTYKARLYQRTGYDWKNVKITVSSANPSMNNNRPLMSPKYMEYAVYAFRPVESTGMISNMMQAERIDNLPSRPSMSNPSIPNLPVYAVIEEERDIQIEFVLEESQSIPSDGKEHICKLQDCKIPATYKYHAVPKLDPNAFLLARITDYGQYNLLAGDANVFYGETYIGQVQLNPQITADTLLISLGRDERIVIKRTRVQNKISKRLFGSIQKDTYAWETTIRNNKGVSIDIEILDQIPLTRREEIVVNLLDKDGADYNKVFGKLLWNFTIKPNERKKISLEYSVEYPEGKVVQEQ